MNASRRELLYIDSAYSLTSVRDRGHESFLESRHRAGYFHRVWGIHPQVGLLEGNRAEAINFVRFSARQTLLDGFVPGRRLPRWRRPVNFLWAHVRLVRTMLRIARRPNVSAVFSTDTFYNGLLATIVGRLSGKPVMVAAYMNQDELYAATGALAFPRLLPFRWLELLVQHFVLRMADYVDAPTENMRNHVLHRGAQPDKVVVVPVAKFVPAVHLQEPGERPSPDAFLRARGIPTDKPRMFQVGRLLPLKHSDDGIRAMIRVLQQLPDVIGLVAGEGPQRAELEAMIARAGMKERLFLLGSIDHPTISSLIPGSVTLSPLTGLALIETSLGGSPAVAYDRDWQPEFVKSNRNGYVVRYRDYEAMADKVLQLMRDPALRIRLGERARRDALAFSDPVANAAREGRAMDVAIARHAARRSSRPRFSTDR